MANDRTTMGRWLADAAVLASVASAVGALVLIGWEPALRFGAMTLVMLAVRRAEVPPTFTAAFAALLLLATWASVLHWYRDIPHVDLLVHLVTPGSMAAVACFVAAGWEWLPHLTRDHDDVRGTAPVLWTVVLGTTLAVLWEFYEWVVEQWAPHTMIVGYTDTVLDLAAGMLGSLVAGVLVLAWSRRHPADRAPAVGR